VGTGFLQRGEVHGPAGHLQVPQQLPLAPPDGPEHPPLQEVGQGGVLQPEGRVHVRHGRHQSRRKNTSEMKIVELDGRVVFGEACVTQP